jgi:hypothetical protein
MGGGFCSLSFGFMPLTLFPPRPRVEPNFGPCGRGRTPNSPGRTGFYPGYFHSVPGFAPSAPGSSGCNLLNAKIFQVYDEKKRSASTFGGGGQAAARFPREYPNLAERGWVASRPQHFRRAAAGAARTAALQEFKLGHNRTRIELARPAVCWMLAVAIGMRHWPNIFNLNSHANHGSLAAKEKLSAGPGEASQARHKLDAPIVAVRFANRGPGYER